MIEQIIRAAGKSTDGMPPYDSSWGQPAPVLMTKPLKSAKIQAILKKNNYRHVDCCTNCDHAWHYDDNLGCDLLGSAVSPLNRRVFSDNVCDEHEPLRIE